MEETKDHKYRDMDKNFFMMRSVDENTDELAIGECFR